MKDLETDFTPPVQSLLSQTQIKMLVRLSFLRPEILGVGHLSTRACRRMVDDDQTLRSFNDPTGIIDNSHAIVGESLAIMAGRHPQQQLETDGGKNAIFAGYRF